jgi:hypothetical protein
MDTISAPTDTISGIYELQQPSGRMADANRALSVATAKATIVHAFA